MNRLAVAMISALLMCAGSAVYAQDAMSKAATPKDAMSHDAMSADSGSKDSMAKDTAATDDDHTQRRPGADKGPHRVDWLTSPWWTTSLLGADRRGPHTRSCLLTMYL